MGSATELQAGFARRLRAARVWRGFTTQKKLADRIGVSSDAVQTWEAARNYPSEMQRLMLIDVLDVSADWLFYGRPRGLSKEAYTALVVDGEGLPAAQL